MLKLPVPVADFKVFPFRTKLFFRVKIFKTLGELRKYAAAVLGQSENRQHDTAALVYATYEFSETEQLKPLLGEILFCQKYLDWDTITHELGHATLRLAERKGWAEKLWERDENGAAGPHEEELCYALGRMAGQIQRRIRVL